jgi:hypothetical protein
MATLRESYTVNTDYMGGSGDPAYWRGQYWTTAAAYKITSIKLTLGRDNSGASGEIRIYACDANHHPTGAALCSGTIPMASVPDYPSNAIVETTLGTGANLSASTEYAMVIVCDNTISIYKYGKNPAGGYANGFFIYSNNSGSTWTDTPDGDFYFEIWGEDIGGGPAGTSNLLSMMGVGS